MIKAQISIADEEIIFNIYDDTKDYRNGEVFIRGGSLASLILKYRNGNVVRNKFIRDIIGLANDSIIDAKQIRKIIPESSSLIWERSTVEGAAMRRIASTNDVNYIFDCICSFNSEASGNEVLSQEKIIQKLINLIFIE